MSFKEAYELMKSGLRVKRPGWQGYWYIEPLTNKLTIHLANGEEITNGDLGMTISNTLANDWIVL